MNVPEIRKAAVIGTGVMGADIAFGFAMAGYDVTGVDVESTPLDIAAKKISVNCQQLIDEGIFSEKDAEETKSRISLTLDWDEAVGDADYVTEAVAELMTLKKAVFKKCDQICRKDVVIASNTSSMSVTEFASEMKYPQRAISTHWIIPAHLSPIVEVVCGEETSTATKELVFDLLTKIGKKPVSCKDSPGFIHNYVQFAMVKAALELAERQIARPEDIDTVIKNGFGLRLSSVGPIQFVDMCGLDTILNIQKYMHGITKDPVYKPSGSIEELVDKGDLGVKTGKGFYDYSANASEEFGERTNRGIMKVRKALKQI
jgi:3-hydroxybutyryl-CoA dehydrogenase